VNDVPPGALFKKGQSAPTIKALQDFSKRYPLASLLPYEAYEQETGLYYNRDTIGFLLYASPATGLSPVELKILNGIYNQNHSADTTIQVSIISDPNIRRYLTRWEENKRDVTDPHISQICQLLAKNRVEYLASGKWNSLFTDQTFLLKNFHLVISYSVPVPKGLKTVEMPDEDIERLIRARDATIGTLRSAKIYSENMEPEVFINIMNGMLNPCSSDEEIHLDYDENNLINSQIIDKDTMALFGSGASSLIHKEAHYSILPYHVRQFPQQWGGFNNGELIGSFFNNILRIPCPFIITLTVSAPDQVTAKGKVQRKSIRATQMADSPLAKYAIQWRDRKVDWDYTAKKSG
jgi:conjugal transfer ATP-binding protein TraC